MVHPCATGGLSAWDQVGCYCERGLDPGFWAEPLNALSNLAFFIAAVMAYADLRCRRPQRGDWAIVALILLVMVVGTGSFLFHTLATTWARAADALPIAVFVFAYLMLALSWFFGRGPLVAGLVALAVAAASSFLPPWLNGSFTYAPALLALLTVGILLRLRGHRAAGWIMAASGVFAVSLVLRTIDLGPGCLVHPPDAADPQFRIGTHPFWHVLNAAVLYLLLRAAIGNAPRERPFGAVGWGR